jgi:RNA polymerase-binding transcription factor DksA
VRRPPGKHDSGGLRLPRAALELPAERLWLVGAISMWEFGYCAECGEEILAGRLDIDPTFHLCVRCSEQKA